MHDTDPSSLLRWELRQRTESGYDTADIEGPIQLALASGGATTKEIDELSRQLLATTRRSDWAYDEPEALADIVATLPKSTASHPRDEAVLSDKLLGAWSGRCAGCVLGKPIELGDYWTHDHIKSYLKIAGAWPLDDYIPALDPMPSGYELRECWPTTTRGNIVASARDDDIDYAILALHLLETYGRDYLAADVAAEWLGRLPYTETYTAERATYRNLVNGLDVSVAGEVNNPYREWIGAQIRADVFGYVNPGDPRTAAVLAYQDAVLSHRANGIYGAMWAAALVAAAFSAGSARETVVESLNHIPPGSRLHEALVDVVSLYDRGHGWESARAAIDERLGHYVWVHTISNAAMIVAGLLWADSDFSQSIVLTTVGGLDTDSNGATAGSVAGALNGAKNISAQWVQPLNDTVRSSLAGFDGVRISDLAHRTQRLIGATQPVSTPFEERGVE